MTYGSGKYPPFRETLSTVGVWRYPKQMTWPSAVATTTFPLATAGEDVTGEAASYFPDFLAAGEIEPVDAAVVGADEYAAAGDRRRRVDAGARGERPERLARLRLERARGHTAPRTT